MKLHQLFDRMDMEHLANKWASDWTDFHAPHDIPSGNLLDALLAILPLRNGLTLYRGIMFKTQSDYEKFKSDTKNFTVLDSKLLTSWTVFDDYAENYADFDHNGDGFAAVVIKTKGIHGQGFDLRKAEHTEPEIVLMPGSFKISLHKELIHK